MTAHYEQLLQKVYEINDLSKATAVLGWDQQVNMPPKGVVARVQQLTTLSRLIHQMATSDEMGELIEKADAEQKDAPYDSFEAALMRKVKRDHERARKIPQDFVVRSSQVSGAAHPAWVKAREENDFASFQPHLEQVVVLCQELADYLGYEDEKYDALLDQYEQGMKTADVRAIFSALKDELVPLRAEIDERGTAVDDAVLHQPYDIAKQKEFVRFIVQAIGYDFERGHLGTVVHPFATSFGRDDSRITTRWYPDFLNPALFGGLHEAGHAMYEQGTHPDLARTPLARGTSLGFHESQSRMMENLVGRSLPFWQAHYPKLQVYFPDQLGNVSLDTFYRAINKVQPSYIRVEADELTYNFHIILRFELEQAMLKGDLAVADLPTAWNDKMQELLGVTPPTDSDGCLQDIHWTRPGFGYFPTYALGNLYAAQLWTTATAQKPAILEELGEGKTTTLLEWLGENIHQHGSKFPPGELMQSATDQTLSHDAFVSYAKNKFSAIYNL